jgi:aspartate/glutamate racemase
LPLIGGMNLECTEQNHQLLNRIARARLDAQLSASLLVWPFDFALVT